MNQLLGRHHEPKSDQDSAVKLPFISLSPCRHLVRDVAICIYFCFELELIHEHLLTIVNNRHTLKNFTTLPMGKLSKGTIGMPVRALSQHHHKNPSL